MEKQLIALNLNLSMINKAKLYQGKKGKYLSAVLHISQTVDQYGNNGFVVESISKEERDGGQRGTIIGNAKYIGQKPEASPVAQVTAYTPPAESKPGSYSDDDLPF